MTQPNIKSLPLPKLAEIIKAAGQPAFRAKQLFTWLYQKHVDEFEAMTDLPKGLREQLPEMFDTTACTVTHHETSEDGTVKMQFTLPDGAAVEGVLIPDLPRVTLCLSTQVGCKMGCSFCFTAGLGHGRNLETWEIVEQYRLARQFLPKERSRITNIVMMGMGEPLDNYDAVKESIEIFTEKSGYFISPNKITVSTVGLAPTVERFHDECSANLAWSLNATTDAVRNTIMPINKKYNIERMIKALQTWPPKRRKRIFLEYVLLAGINDTMDDALRLSSIARRLGCKVNLIPYNEPDTPQFKRPAQKHIMTFEKVVYDQGVQVTIRNSRGLDLHAACGMLGKTVSD